MAATINFMSNELSQQNEQFLTDAIAAGLFPSRQAALDAAVDVLRVQQVPLEYVSEEHMEGVEAALDELDAGLGMEMTPQEWESLRQLAHDVAEGRRKAAS